MKIDPIRRDNLVYVARQILDMHDNAVSLGSGPRNDEEWTKVRHDYLSACRASAAILASGLLDALGELRPDVLPAPESR